MKIAVAVKLVYDDADIVVSADGSLDFSHAHRIISAYDLNAIECAVRLKEAHEGSTLTALSVGSAALDDSKLKKSILSRGVDSLLLVADDAAGQLDAYQSAQALWALAEIAGGFDLVVCGDGSADNYAQQTDVQLASALGVPIINAVTELVVEEGMLRATRLLEDEMQTVETKLPCVVSVMPDRALPRIVGMKEILAAGKKPTQVLTAEDIFGVAKSGIETLVVRAPDLQQRRGEIYELGVDGGLEAFIKAFLALARR
jgi:electron transfer flavoprotein beta subunit